MKEQTTRTPPKLRVLSAFLAVAMLLTLLPVTAFAEDPTVTKNGVTYIRVNNNPVWWITGTYTGNATSLTLENYISGQAVNYMQAGVFKGNTTLTYVKLPDNGMFSTIGSEAFAGCTNLETVVAPATLGDVGERAFQGCTKLKSLALGRNSAHIYESAFEGCTSLKSIQITGTMVYIDDTAFKGCTNLTSVILPKYLEEMGNNVFEGCTNLQEITLPKEIRSFGDNVFAGCTKLKKIIYNGKSTEWANCPANGKIPDGVQVVCIVPLTTYGISVCGTTVNEANYSNVLGDGKVEYTPDSNSLQLNSVNLSYNSATTAAIDDTDSTRDELTIMGMGYSNDTVENTSGPGIKTTGKLYLNSSHIIVKGTPAISAQSITMSTYNRWYRTSPNGPFVKYTEGSVEVGNAPYFEVIRSQDDPNETGITLWIDGRRMPKIEGWESYDVFNDGTALLEEYDYGVRGEMHCTLNLKNANWKSDDTAILTRVDQLTISGTGTIKGGKNAIRSTYGETAYGPQVSIDDANLTFTGGLDLAAGASIINSTVKINGWTDYGIKADSNLVIDGSDVTIASETGEYALCPRIIEMKENSTLRLQGAKSIANGGDQRCIIYTKYWYRTSPDGEYTEGTDTLFELNPSNTYFELTTIDPYAVKTYDLWVAGKQVTETNQNDVLGDGGSVKFDPATNTLTLKDANLTPDGNANFTYWIDSDITKELTITGTATLSNADGILTDGPLTLDNATLTLTGDNNEEDGGVDEAIRAGSSNEDITIQNSTVTIAGKSAGENFFQFGIRCGNLIVANSTLDVKANSSAIVADTMEVSSADTIVLAETDSTDEDDYALALDDETSLTLHDGLALVVGKVNESKTAKIALPEQNPDPNPNPDPDPNPDPNPKPDPDDEDVFLQFEDCSVDVEKPDGTALHVDALTGVIQSERLPKGAKVTITLDEKAIPEGMKFSCWVFDPRPEDLMEDGTTATFTMQEDIGVLAKFSMLEEEDSSADFGTIAAATAVVGVVGATAYLVGTEVALNQLLPAGISVPQDRAQLALLLWNTAGRPEPAALPAFADVTDPDTAKAAQWCMEAGFFQPREDGSFKPGKHVSRWKVLRTYQQIVK